MTKKPEQQNNAKLVTASGRYLRISPRKMRLVTNLVKNLPVADALTQLQFTNKKAAEFLIKLLQSAVANAKQNFSLDPGKLYIKTITADSGGQMKRYFPRARGSAFTIRRKMSHVNVVLAEKLSIKPKKFKAPLFKEKAKKDETQEQGVNRPEMVIKDESQKEEAKKTSAPRSSEQKKENRVQQKRRLFTRKTGE